MSVQNVTVSVLNIYTVCLSWIVREMSAGNASIQQIGALAPLTFADKPPLLSEAAFPVVLWHDRGPDGHLFLVLNYEY